MKKSNQSHNEDLCDWCTSLIYEFTDAVMGWQFGSNDKYKKEMRLRIRVKLIMEKSLTDWTVTWAV
jgi:hypothetical protein